MHQDTFELVQREYLWACEDMPGSIDIAQIMNTIRHYGPDINAVIACVRRGDKILLENITKYPQEAYKFINSLAWSAEFYERVQEVDSKLRLRDLNHNRMEKDLEQIAREAA